METNNNVDIPAEELLSLLKQQIDFFENQMAERCGMKLYKSANGFPGKRVDAYLANITPITFIFLTPLTF